MATKNRSGLSRKAINLLRKVEAYILEEPKRLDMDMWGDFFTTDRIRNMERWGDDTSFIPPCNTTACIAGTVHLLASPKSLVPKKDDSDTKWQNFFGKSERFAKKTLGLSKQQAAALFSPPTDSTRFGAQGWPDEFAKPYVRAKNRRQHKQAAEIAVARIEHFIKTGE